MLLEIILSIVLVLGVLLFIGVPFSAILSWLLIGLSGLLVLAIALIALFFLIADISLLFCRRVSGEFVRFEDHEKFERAVYRVGDTEYICKFPAESVARRQIYGRTQTHSLLIPRAEKRKTAYDRHSLMIIAVGSVCSVTLVALTILVALRVLPML